MQLTWFRNKMDVIWFNMTDIQGFTKKINEISGFVAGKLFDEGEYINLERKEED